jgi:membrane-bound lytic murein transglycosylase F
MSIYTRIFHNITHLPFTRLIASRHLLVSLLTVLALSGCQQQNNLESVKQSGVLEVITRNSPTTYYLDREGAAGFEYELAKGFADYLGVTLKVRTSSSFPELIEQVNHKQVSFAAAGLTADKRLEKDVRFSHSYQDVTQQLVYRRKGKQPNDLSSLINGTLVVSKGSDYAARLAYLKQHQLPTLTWQEAELSVVELMQMVTDGDIDFTIANSHEINQTSGYFPHLKAAFDISEPSPLAWAFPKGRDDSLYDAADDYFNKIINDGSLRQLKERYYGHLKQLNTVGTLTFLAQTKKKLEGVKPNFEKAADQFKLDWRLLAAIGYQESHWKSDARSPTGVRGLMMLTRITAKEVGVTDRLDTQQSIDGGAQYFNKLRKRLAGEIQEPDRTWFALAAYNVGMGHVRDAQKITVKQGGDPTRWMDVKERLPLLTKKKWFSQTRYGYARGHEPVHYVQNIRRYYDLLVWYDNYQNVPSEAAEEVLASLQLAARDSAPLQSQMN